LEVELREKLAELAHEQWSGWMRYLFSFNTLNGNGSYTIPAELVERWKRQMETAYSELPENEQAKANLTRVIKSK
jgi:hypothetical protein